MTVTLKDWWKQLLKHSNSHITLYMDQSPKYIQCSLQTICNSRFSFFVITFFLLSLSKSFAQGVMPDTPQVNTIIPTDTGNTDIQKNDNTVFATDTLHTDSTASVIKKQGRHSPLKAALFSAVLPGLGQAYNKHYWKIPIVYAGFGGLGYALYISLQNFNGYRDAYRQQEAIVPNIYASYGGITDPASLKEYRDYYKKYVDISAIGIGVWYVLTIVDAAVDAHLYEWNMRDDLSVSWHPVMINSGSPYGTPGIGAAFALHF